MIEEVWKSVKGFEACYEISNLGNVKSLDRHVLISTGSRFQKGRTISQRINNCGYVSVRLSKNGYTKTCFIHRLLAEAFLSNPDELPMVNHIDGNKLNNLIENLEWCSHSQNIQHAYDNGMIDSNKGKNHYKACLLVSSTGELFYTIKQAAENAEMNYNTVRHRLRTSENPPFRELD
jgi:hypothetical protein